MAAGERACRSCTNQRNCSSMVFVDGANAAFPECFKSPDTPIRYRQLRGLFSTTIRQRLILERNLKGHSNKNKNIGGPGRSKEKKSGAWVVRILCGFAICTLPLGFPGIETSRWSVRYPRGRVGGGGSTSIIAMIVGWKRRGL